MRYQYRCEEHGAFELHQGMMELHVANCPMCSRPADRVFTPTIFYMPDCLWNKDGSKQDAGELPVVYGGNPKYYRGI